MPVISLKSRTEPSVRPNRAPPPPGTVQTENELCDRLAAAAPGDIVTYYVGMLAADRSPNSLALTEAQRLELDALAGRMFQLAEAGRVHLVQRRVGPERFAYLAIVRPVPLQTPRDGRAVPVPIPRSRVAA